MPGRGEDPAGVYRERVGVDDRPARSPPADPAPNGPRIGNATQPKGRISGMPVTPFWRDAVDGLQRDLAGVVGERLRCLLVYEAHGTSLDAPAQSSGAGIRHENLAHTLALVEELGFDDLNRLSALAAGWEKRGLAVPLLLAPRELARSLDSFPLEFAQILARHTIVFGDDPFTGQSIDRNDLRRACETQVRSHLVHLREGYLQSGGDARLVADLVAASAVPLRALLVNIGRLNDIELEPPAALLDTLEKRWHLDAAGLRPVVLPGGRASALKGPGLADVFPRYLQAVEQLARLVDEWAL
jgi:hypothetical protein